LENKLVSLLENQVVFAAQTSCLCWTNSLTLTYNQVVFNAKKVCGQELLRNKGFMRKIDCNLISIPLKPCLKFYLQKIPPLI